MTVKCSEFCAVPRPQGFGAENSVLKDENLRRLMTTAQWPDKPFDAELDWLLLLSLKKASCPADATGCALLLKDGEEYAPRMQKKSDVPYRFVLQLPKNDCEGCESCRELRRAASS